MFLQMCPVCEHRNPRGSRFCNECGSPLQLRFCPACHAAEDVMALECRSCGEKLPLVPLAEPPPVFVEPTGESIFRTDAPPPGFHLGSDGVAVTVHGGGEATAVLEAALAAETEPVAVLARETAVESETVDASEHVPEPAASVEPVLVPAEPVLVTRGPNTIELFNAAPTELGLSPLSVSLPPAEVAEPAAESVVLNAESESEIEVSAEAETLVEASVAQVTYQRPEEIAIAESAPLEQIATQLREDAWRSAMVDGDVETRLAPVLIPKPLPQRRRLSVQRIGLMIAGLGAAAAVVYSGHLAPGTASNPAQVATPKPITVPARSAVDTLAPAGVLTAASPDATHARSVESQPSAQTPQPITRAAEAPQDRTAAAAVIPATVAAQTDTQPPARATPAREPAAPPVAQARRLPLEAPRPCTPAIEALGLCTMEAPQEGK
jgi:hypothetical protein